MLTKEQKRRLDEIFLKRSQLDSEISQYALKTSLTDIERFKYNELLNEKIKLEEEFRSIHAVKDVQPYPNIDPNGDPIQTQNVQTIPTPQKSDDKLEELRKKVRVSNYVACALSGRPLEGAEREYNDELKIVDGRHGVMMPINLLAPKLFKKPEMQKRQDVVTNTAVNNQLVPQRWLDRIFEMSKASRLGVSFETIASGEPSYSLFGNGVNPAMPGKGQAKDAEAANISVEKLTPKRLASRYLFSKEDSARLSGMEEALVRDLSAAMTSKMDDIIFQGSNTAGEQINGLLEADSSTQEVPFAKGSATPKEIIEHFVELIDGIYADGFGGIRLVLNVAANAYLMSTLVANQSSRSIAEKLNDFGLMWSVFNRGPAGIANNAYVGAASKPNGREGGAVAGVWQGMELIRDPYSDANKGQVGLTSITLWDFKVLRSTNFIRIQSKNA